MLALLTVVLVLSVVWHPLDDGGFILCPFRRLTGLPCMGCGMTRSFCALAKGEVGRSIAFHPLGPIFFSAPASGGYAVLHCSLAIESASSDSMRR